MDNNGYYETFTANHGYAIALGLMAFIAIPIGMKKLYSSPTPNSQKPQIVSAAAPRQQAARAEVEQERTEEDIRRSFATPRMPTAQPVPTRSSGTQPMPVSRSTNNQQVAQPITRAAAPTGIPATRAQASTYQRPTQARAMQSRGSSYNASPRSQYFKDYNSGR